MSFGAVAGGIGGIVGGLLGGGGDSQPSTQTNQNGSIGQGIGNILAGGLSSALGISGLVGQNANQLQAGAAAANPFGQYAGGFVPMLQQLLGGGQGSLIQQLFGQNSQEQGLLGQALGQSQIGTNTGGLSALGNTGAASAGVNSQLQGMLNNPTQLMQALQGGVSTPSGLQALANADPTQLTQGQQFQQDQGLQSLNRSLAATGQIGSGNQYAAAEQYGQNFASQAYQQNVSNSLNAQQSINQTSQTNQGIQGLMNQMGQNQFGNASTLSQLLSGQSQNNFNNQLATQQLQSSQQQNSFTNVLNSLQSLIGMNSGQSNSMLQLLGPLLTATQASNSSPSTAGGILANLGVANQQSGSNIASGLAGLGSGIGQLASNINFGGSGTATGSFSGGNFAGAFADPSTGYSGGGNSFGFTI